MSATVEQRSLMHPGDHYDEVQDAYTINEIKVSRQMFRFLSNPANIGKVFRLISLDKDGVVIAEVIPKKE